MVIAEELLDRIETNGHRATTSRLGLLDVMTAHSHGFTVADLVVEVKGLRQAPVYQTVRLLVEHGLLCNLPLQDGATRYTLSTKTGHHHHLVCTRCGNVQEFRQSVMGSVLANLAAGDTGTVVSHRIELYVLCPTCQTEESSTVPSQQQ